MQARPETSGSVPGASTATRSRVTRGWVATCAPGATGLEWLGVSRYAGQPVVGRGPHGCRRLPAVEANLDPARILHGARFDKHQARHFIDVREHLAAATRAKAAVYMGAITTNAAVLLKLARNLDRILGEHNDRGLPGASDFLAVATMAVQCRSGIAAVVLVRYIPAETAAAGHGYSFLARVVEMGRAILNPCLPLDGNRRSPLFQYKHSNRFVIEITVCDILTTDPDRGSQPHGERHASSG